MDREEYLEEHLNFLYGEEVDDPTSMYAPNIYQTKQDFRAGYTAAKIEWNKVEDKLPDTDRRVLVWLEDTKVPHWSGYRIGAYLNENWYLDGGRASHEIVTQWYDFPDVEI